MTLNQINQIDAAIIGGGPAGLAAAISLYKKGITNILVVEREEQLGGILRQCIHDGFGLTRFQSPLSGPEYADRFIREVRGLGIACMTKTAVTDLSPDKIITTVSSDGMKKWQAKAVILAMGCRERTRGALGIPGERPAGVFTAGVAQAYINLYNLMPAKEVVILGSGDIGMIMARRLSLEGAHVQAVLEIQPYPSGLPRNIQQCLNDYGIPLLLSHTVTAIHGSSRLTGVTVSQVDEQRRPIPGTETEYHCDTLILSVGLIPENELSEGAGVSIDGRTSGAVVDQYYQTDVEGVFSAGNVLHVHDLVDFVSMESEKLAEHAAEYIQKGSLPKCEIRICPGENINHTVPQRASGDEPFTLSLRVNRPLKDATLLIRQDETVIFSKKYRKAIPAEMIQVNVEAERILSKSDLEVTIG